MNNDRYFDQTFVRLALGAHGLGPKFTEYEGEGLVRLYQSEENLESSNAPLYVYAESSSDLTHHQCVASRQVQSSQDYNTHNKPLIVEFIHFGRSHRYYAWHYALVAPYWRDCLFAEARNLSTSILMDMATAQEFLKSDGSLSDELVHLLQRGVDLLKDMPTIKPDDFKILWREVIKQKNRLMRSTAEDYFIIHDVGLELERIRYHHKYLRSQFINRVEELRETAEVGLKAAIETENAAFWVLDLYGQVRYAYDPLAEAAYRCGVLFVRAGARFVGEKLADNSTRDALRAAGIMIRGDLPKIISSLILGYMKKGLKNPQNPSFGEQFAQEIVGLAIWAVFFTVDFYVFETKKLSSAGKANANDIFLKKLAPQLAVQIVNSIINIFFNKQINKFPENSPQRIWLERLAAALPVLIVAVLTEYLAMKQRADDEKREFYEVFCAEAGWALVRIFKAVGMALLEAPIKNSMQNKMASDKELTDKKYWESLIRSVTEITKPITDLKAFILAVKLQIAEITPSFLKPRNAAQVAWDQEASQITPGPGENGIIGINKLQRVSASPNPINKTTPPKPPTEKIKEVKTAKQKHKKDNRKGKGFTEAYRKAKLKSNADEVKRLYGNAIKEDKPHYMCENCHFIHPSSKDFFPVDHVWDIQHGGDRNRYSREDLQKLLAGLKADGETGGKAIDVALRVLYEKGDNGMVLCKGCNNAKNTIHDNSPGLIPKEKGYAYTRKNEDRNPKHIYQGGPD